MPPRIAILALNPHAGDDGNSGDEEREIIKPAIEKLEQEGIQAFGPYPADDFFGRSDYQSFDAVLAMYYEQGITPLKTIAPDGGIILTTGLPYVQTAPDQGACLDIAGKRAQVESLQKKTEAADFWDDPKAAQAFLKNLSKLYHEKRDDSEKVRFAVPKSKQATPAK